MKHIELTPENVWQDVLLLAQKAGLDPNKLGEKHEAIIQQVVAFLRHPLPQPSPLSWWQRLRGIEQQPVANPVAPIIICGIPGTGKTTFLYSLDIVLRSYYGLPDLVEGQMEKANGRSHTLTKRLFNGQQTSLLSVRAWSELLHFYEWDVQQHRFVAEELSGFLNGRLAPMRVLFADEVEMTGYSPAIPKLAKHGFLVVGTSNQYQFAQLAGHELSAQIIEFAGDDMRMGDPADVVVTEKDDTWQLFQRGQTIKTEQFERLPYQRFKVGQKVHVLLEFQQAMNAPMLETEWITFFEASYREQKPATDCLPYTLLLDQFSLDWLAGNYNALMRFVALFDAVEQLGVGVFVRHRTQTAPLSHAVFERLQETVQTAVGIPPDIKQKVTVGLGRCASRIGQAAHRAYR